MDIDELDELVDFEEDAMMTDAVEDANGEIDMDPVDQANLDGDEEMSEAGEEGPGGVTVSIAMTPNPFGLPDGMQEEVTMSTVEIAPAVTEWPPAPTSIPAVPSRLPEATLVPSLLQHDEGKILRSEVNSIAAEPPASPSKTLLSVNAFASRPPSPPITAGNPDQEPVSADQALAEVIPDAVDASVDDNKEKTTQSAMATLVNTGDEVIVSEPGLSQDATEGKNIEAVGADEARDESGLSHPVETEPTAEPNSTTALKEDVKAHAQALSNGHEEKHTPVENESENEQYDDSHPDHDNQAGDHDENVAKQDYPPIVIEIVPGVVRPLFFPLAKELWSEIERPDVPETDEKSDPERSLLTGLATELFKAPLRDLFVALRAVLGEDWDESRGTEMILHEKALGLKIGEDNKFTETLTLHDLVDLYIRCNCSEPMCLYVEYETVRFIAKYNAIKDVLDHNAAPPDVDSSTNGEEEDQDAELDESHEQDGQGQQAEFEEHDGEHEQAEEHDVGDYDEQNEEGTEGEGHFDEEGDDHEEVYHNEEQGEAVQVETNVDSSPAGDALQSENTPSDEHASKPKEAAFESVEVRAASPEPGAHVLACGGEPIYDEHDEHDELDEEDHDDQASDADGDTFGIDAAVRHTEMKAESASLGGTSANVEQGPSAVKAGSSSPDGNTLKRGPEDEVDLDSERSAKRVFSGDDIEA